jgi:hypothetical protein
MGIVVWLGNVFNKYVEYSLEAARHSSEFELLESWRTPMAKDQPEGRDRDHAD